MQSITRKFIVTTPPDLNGKECLSQNRFYLYRKNGIVIRVQSKGDKFELERKIDKSNIVRESEKIAITKDEFMILHKNVVDEVIRESYLINENPNTTLMVYHGKFEGLARAETKFLTAEEAIHFSPPAWMGKEITDSPLGKDETLLDLNDADFKSLL